MRYLPKIRLSKGQVILLHKRLIETTGGSNGIRDDRMLDSASGKIGAEDILQWIISHQK